MVIRPESPVENTQNEDDWFCDYMWMNDPDKFEEEYLNSLHLEELNKVAEQIEDELLEIELSQNVENLNVEPHGEQHTRGGGGGDNLNNGTNANLQEILANSILNPDAQEFVPATSAPSR